MTALTADRNVQSMPATLKSYPVAASTSIYKGAMVCVTGGYLVPAADAAGYSRVAGVANEQVDNSSGTAGAKTCGVVSGRAFKMPATSITQAMVSSTMYVVDDATFDDGIGINSIVAGVLLEYVSTTEGWIFIGTPQ